MAIEYYGFSSCSGHTSANPVIQEMAAAKTLLGSTTVKYISIYTVAISLLSTYQGIYTVRNGNQHSWILELLKKNEPKFLLHP